MLISKIRGGHSDEMIPIVDIHNIERFIVDHAVQCICR